MTDARCFHCGRVRSRLVMQRTALQRFICANTNDCTTHFAKLRKAQAEATSRGLVQSYRDTATSLASFGESVDQSGLGQPNNFPIFEIAEAHVQHDYSAPDASPSVDYSSSSDSFSGGGGDFGGGGASGEF